MGLQYSRPVAECDFDPFRHAVTTIRVVTNDRDEPEFHDVVLWRNLAEIAGQYLAKGRLVYIEGWLHGRSWEQDGTTRRRVEIAADSLQMMSQRPQELPAEG